jgi:hypothetical protein
MANARVAAESRLPSADSFMNGVTQVVKRWIVFANTAAPKVSVVF